MGGVPIGRHSDRKQEAKVYGEGKGSWEPTLSEDTEAVYSHLSCAVQ